MKVKFVPQNVEFEIKPGESVMHLAEDNGIYVKSVCRGVPSCAECRVKIVDGETNVFAPVAAELALVGSGWFIDRRRLSCQLQCIGDVTVDMSEQLAKQSGLIGGRKAKAAKAIGDRVEDETVIRESTAGGDRDSGRGGRRNARDLDEADEAESETEERPQAPRPAQGKQPTISTARPETRPQGNGVVIGAGKIEPRAPGSAPPSGPKPIGDAPSNRDGGGGPGGEGRGGRSRRGGRGRR